MRARPSASRVLTYRWVSPSGPGASAGRAECDTAHGAVPAADPMRPRRRQCPDMSELDLVAGLGEPLGSLRQVDALGLRILHDHRACADERPRGDLDGVTDGRVDPE